MYPNYSQHATLFSGYQPAGGQQVSGQIVAGAQRSQFAIHELLGLNGGAGDTEYHHHQQQHNQPPNYVTHQQLNTNNTTSAGLSATSTGEFYSTTRNNITTLYTYNII